MPEFSEGDCLLQPMPRLRRSAPRTRSALIGGGDVLEVDVRDASELQSTGQVKG